MAFYGHWSAEPAFGQEYSDSESSSIHDEHWRNGPGVYSSGNPGLYVTRHTGRNAESSQNSDASESEEGDSSNPNSSDDEWVSVDGISVASDTSEEWRYDDDGGTKARNIRPNSHRWRPNKKLRRSKRVSFRNPWDPPLTAIPTEVPEGLDFFSGLPLDIYTEILPALRTPDLVSMSRVNKAFRRLLLRREIDSIWTNALEIDGIMPCPAGLNLHAWAHLLAGPSRCQECELVEVPDGRIDFWLLRRLCYDCLEENLVSSLEFKEQFPGHSRTILGLVRYTRVQPPHFRTYGERHFWMPDITRMYRKRWDYLQSSLPLYEQVEVWRGFCADQKDLLRLLNNVAKEAQKWATGVRAADRVVGKQQRKDRYKEIKNRFLELGFENADVAAIFRCPGVRIRAPLTATDWDLIQLRYTSKVTRAAEARLAREREERFEKRQDNLKSSYEGWVKGCVNNGKFSISQWPLLPHASNLLTAEPFRSRIHADLDLSVDIGVSDEEFSSYVTSWMDGRLRELADVAPKRAENAAPSILPLIERLSPAIEVFRCRHPGCSNRPLFGCKAVLMHDHEHPDHREIQFFPAGSAVVKALIPLCCIDDTERCLPSDLDDVDLRFWCLDCGQLKDITTTRMKTHYKGRRIYTWRECVAHSMKASSDKHQKHQLRWGKLSERESVLVKSYEQSPYSVIESVPERNRWSCNWCAAHVHSSCPLSEVLLHITSEHKITKPKDSVDYFHVMHHGRLQVDSGVILLDGPPVYLCKVKSCGDSRLFTLSQMLSHFEKRDRHGLQSGDNPVIGQHMGEFKCFGGTCRIALRNHLDLGGYPLRVGTKR